MKPDGLTRGSLMGSATGAWDGRSLGRVLTTKGSRIEAQQSASCSLNPVVPDHLVLWRFSRAQNDVRYWGDRQTELKV
jgi:hypothetical protein